MENIAVPKKYLRWISKQVFGQSRLETGTLNLSRSRRRRVILRIPNAAE